MKDLNIFIEINGVQHIVGRISGTGYADSCFRYDRSYLDMDHIMPISVHLPLREEPFSADDTASFFEGLLPEGFSRRAVANWARSDANDYIRILKKLGQECLGALQIVEEGSEVPMGSYELLSEDKVKALAAEGASKSTELLLETHLSLTGATGKVGLYYDQPHDAWYLPMGNAASTHIVKQSHVRLDQIVLNEQICVRTARNIGIDVPDSFIINMEDGRDADVLYATRRYDRILSTDRKIDGLPVPMRLHQEDFAQAMGIHSIYKYETVKREYLKRMFALIRKTSSNPLEDQVRLWDMIVFHFLIGNTDCHLKNYSLLYKPDMTGIRLAPAYDIVCTRAYRSTKDMSFFVGNEVNLEKINRDSFIAAAREIGLGGRMAMKHFDQLADKFEKSLNAAVAELEQQGFSAETFSGRIMENCGYRNLL